FGDRETRERAAKALRDLVPVALATACATFVNPVGPALLSHVIGWFGDTLLINVTQEYQSPDFHQLATRPFVLLLTACVGSVAWSRRRPALHEGLLVLGFTYLALFSQRNMPLFAIVTAPVLLRQLAAGQVPSGRFENAARYIGAWLSRRDRVFARMD